MVRVEFLIGLGKRVEMEKKDNLGEEWGINVNFMRNEGGIVFVMKDRDEMVFDWSDYGRVGVEWVKVRRGLI